MTEQEFYELLFNKLCGSEDAHYQSAAESNYTVFLPIWEPEAYAELAKDIDRTDLKVHIKAGTTVRIVMVSRFEDFGITTNLNAQHGYQIRVAPGDGYLINCRMKR